MDAQAIDMEVLSINPFWYRKERDIAAAIVKMQNEKLAELCAPETIAFSVTCRCYLHRSSMPSRDWADGSRGKIPRACPRLVSRIARALHPPACKSLVQLKQLSAHTA
ncbi:MAG: hypothetical protein WAV78_41855 [Xanthobacteraceae bacterium]|jgi:hypothetical protein